MEEAKPQVKLQRVSSVAPAIPIDQKHPMFLSNLDLLWLPVNNVQRLLFYRIPPGNEYSSIVDRLKKSLASVLVHFYPLAGRIDKGESNIRAQVDFKEQGVEFMEASIQVPFDSLERDGFQYRPFFKNLVPMAHPLQDDDHTVPLLSIQVTAFEGNGFCIGTTLRHVVADGNSFWHFMESWAECSRGLPLSKPPLHSRTIFKRDHQDKRLVSITYKPHEVVSNGISGAQIYKFEVQDDLQPEVQDKTMSTTEEEALKNKREEGIQKWLGQNKTELVYSTFIFTEKMIRDLKQQSGASSSFVAVAAQFWRCLMRAREVADEEPVIFGLLADCRSRVKPPLPPTYFGNCLSIGVARTTAKKLLTEDLCFAVSVIQELVNSCTTPGQINNMVEWLESPDSGFVSLFPEFAGLYGTNVVSSHRFPVYEIDHGWGRALNVQAASMNEIGSMVLFGANDGGRGSIVVSTGLPRHQMDTFTQLLRA